ncbi:MATE family efflux transporter [Vibrio sp. S9_S30]|uniref:MATE family efflux transporter n=1 Tax=Vibrio sp. S9_S30 TaxID=2720226 RepID=UPI00168023FF|nr:MATE family efflux transporter [Vibrio sp. S9_S30]MBD1557744.1 MATE family efflux transporter [Vibrio sp. S9_S30]
MSHITLPQKTDSVTKTFWRYAIPSIVAMVVSGLYQVIDGIFVGHYVGRDGLAGISMAYPVLAIVIGIGLLIGMGGGSVASISRGEGNARCVNHSLFTAIVLIVATGSVGAIFLVMSSGSILSMQGASGLPRAFAEDYVNLLTTGAVLTIGATALPMLVRNDNSPNLATALIVVGAFANILLDYAFLAHLNMGLKGAAMATLIAQLVTCLLGLCYFLSKYSEAKVLYGVFKWHLAKRIIQLGVSTLVMFLYFGFVMALHNKLFMMYGDATHIAAFAIVGYIASMYYYFTEGIANGMQPPVSYDFGAKQYNNIIKTVKLALSVSVSLGIVMVVLVNLSPLTAISLFTTGDAVLTEATAQGVKLHLLALYLDGFLFAASVYFMAIGMGGKALFVSAGNMFIQLPFLWILPTYLGVDGIWLSVPASNLALTLIVLPMLMKSLRTLTSQQKKADMKTYQFDTTTM